MPLLSQYFDPIQVDRWSTIIWRVLGPAYATNFDMGNRDDVQRVTDIANRDADLLLQDILKPVGMKGIFRSKA